MSIQTDTRGALNRSTSHVRACGMPRLVAGRRPAEPPRVVAPEMEDEGPTGLGFWVSSVLFAVTLLLGLGLAGYALVGPFMR